MLPLLPTRQINTIRAMASRQTSQRSLAGGQGRLCPADVSLTTRHSLEMIAA
jgi:hypothetical protein